jgi:thiopeptide-type bacteriocin biosynthesis protein
MKTKPFDNLICRTPAFSIDATMATALAELKLKIKESSPAFFELIRPLTAAQIDQLNDKIKFTLWKYFNRARYRSTPFGSFAAVSIVPLLDLPEEIKLEKAMEADHYVDWSYKETYLNKDTINANTELISNSSIYFTGNEIRYIRIKETVHELASVNAIPELNAVLIACKRKTTVAAIQELMDNTFNMDVASTHNLLLQLLAMQLLSSSQLPNITGMDYFERLAINLPKSQHDYIIAKRKLISGGFACPALNKFPQLIGFLAQQFPTCYQKDLTDFKQAFRKRFENQQVSLAQVMDPEIGIGYGNLAQAQHANPLIEEIKQVSNASDKPSLTYDAFHAFLLNKIVMGKNFQLEEFKATDQSPPIRLPNTFSYLFHLFDGQPVLAYAGGCSANALIGRFTMGNPEMELHAKEIASLEASSNPDVVFFDVAYQAEKRVDNVNRRKIIYPNELPILTWSTLADPLDFSDILVSVADNEVVFKSRKLGKRIIPRIPSAYNYTRSDLAVFRFLCDVQAQGLALQLTFKLHDLFPKLSYYPRMNFHQIIVSPAMWLVPEKIYTTEKIDIDSQLECLKTWLTEQKIDFKFKAGHSDSTLCFDTKSDEDLGAFLIFCKQQGRETYITEALVNDSSYIADQHQNRYLPQYIANFYHREAIYHPLPATADNCLPHQHMMLPGGDWLYFEFYVHVLKSNDLLLNQIHQFLKTYRLKLKKWFFIRYNSPSSHIRLRFQLKNKADGFTLMESLQKMMEPEMNLGRLTDVKIKTYYRETHRYGAERIDLIEDFFEADSKVVLYLLKKSKSEDQLIASNLNLLLAWLNHWMPNLDEQFAFTATMANNFAKEMGIGPDIFKKINLNFNSLKGNLSELTIILPESQLKHYQQLSDKILATCSSSSELQKLLADLVHMHINRLFSTDQRMYETIIYQYLLRKLQIKRAMLKV